MPKFAVQSNESMAAFFHSDPQFAFTDGGTTPKLPIGG